MQVVNTQVSSNTDFGHYNEIYIDAMDILLQHQLDNDGKIMHNDQLYPILAGKYGGKMPERIVFDQMMVKFNKGVAKY